MERKHWEKNKYLVKKKKSLWKIHQALFYGILQHASKIFVSAVVRKSQRDLTTTPPNIGSTSSSVCISKQQSARLPYSHPD